MSVSTPENIALASEVVRLRMTMLAINSLNQQREPRVFRIPIHLALGHEALAVALTAAKQPGDCLLLSHRNIHYNIANQPEHRQIFQEFALQKDGQAQGKLGSMNLTNPEQGLVYTSSILGNNLCVAPGVAMANKVKGDNVATFVVTGDGAMEEGAFYESLLMMKSNELPVIVIVENNGWSMYTQIHERRCPIDVGRLGESLGIPYFCLEGNDVVAYRERLTTIRQQALEQQGPCIVEVGLHTLGDFWTEDKPGAPSRLINYHHGVAPHVDMVTWPQLRDNAEDPLFVLTQDFTAQKLQELAAELHQRISGDLPC